MSSATVADPPLMALEPVVSSPTTFSQDVAPMDVDEEEKQETLVRIEDFKEDEKEETPERATLPASAPIETIRKSMETWCTQNEQVYQIKKLEVMREENEHVSCCVFITSMSPIFPNQYSETIHTALPENIRRWMRYQEVSVIFYFGNQQSPLRIGEWNW